MPISSPPKRPPPIPTKTKPAPRPKFGESLEEYNLRLYVYEHGQGPPPPRPKHPPGSMIMGRNETRAEKMFNKILFGMVLAACVFGIAMVFWLMWQECGGLC